MTDQIARALEAARENDPTGPDYNHGTFCAIESILDSLSATDRRQMLDELLELYCYD